MDKKIVDIFRTSCKLRFVLKLKLFLEKLWIKNKIHKLKLLLLTQKLNNKSQLNLNQIKTNSKRNLTGKQLVLGQFVPSLFSLQLLVSASQK